jgi:hypothetical protein
MDSREWGGFEDAAQHNAGAEHAAFHKGLVRQIGAHKSAVRQAVGFDSGADLSVARGTQVNLSTDARIAMRTNRVD